MKILFIAPLPPPIHGQSLAAEVFFKELVRNNVVEVVDMRKNSHEDGVNSLKRIIEVVQILSKVFKEKSNADIVYLQISESLGGNIKDLFIYLLCFNKLSKMYIHLHGGSIKTLLFDRYRLLNKINKFFISRLAGVIVLGESHVSAFSDLIDAKKIYVAPNFAEDYLFVDEEAIAKKFDDMNSLRILYLSNLTAGKGYLELLEAYIAVEDRFKQLIRVDFAGGFETDETKEEFLRRIKQLPGVSYHGIVKGEQKRELLEKAHVFCLPTGYLEGQPISILEAYAAGCAVICTNKGGIVDIFKDKINGFEIKEKKPESIKSVLEYVAQHREGLPAIGQANGKYAREKFRTTTYNSTLKRIMHLN